MVFFSNSAPEGKLTMSMVTNAMYNEETRRKDIGGNQSHSLVTEDKGKGKGKRRSKSRGRCNNMSKSRDSKSQDNSSFTCFHCSWEGHIKRNCPSQKDKGQSSKSKGDKNTTATTIDEILLVVGEGEDCFYMVDHSYTEWVIDTVASYHATSHRELFSSYNVRDFGIVRIGNSSYSKIVGIGDISIQINVGHKLVLKDVRHVPNLRLNLISGSTLDRYGYISTFENGRWKLTGGASIIARGGMTSTLYKTQTKVCLESLNAVEDKESPDLWHRRLAHISKKGLHLLAKQSRIPLSKGSALKPCDHRLYGKQH